MYLKQIEIAGFRGIKQLTLNLNSEANVLIGENRWGRSSLMSALTLFSPENYLYQFIESDFYRDGKNDANTITIYYTFLENNVLEASLKTGLSCVTYHSSHYHSNAITYQISGKKIGDNIVSEHHFVDDDGKLIHTVDKTLLIMQLLQLNPVIRLKKPIKDRTLSSTNWQPSNDNITQLHKKLVEISPALSPDKVHKGLKAASGLLEYYLVAPNQQHYYKNIAKRATPSFEEWASLKQLNDLLDHLSADSIQVVLMDIINAIFLTSNRQFSSKTVPILILEEPESQLHPIALSVGFRLLTHFPTQKIITTNSSDLIALFPLESVYRLIRSSEGIIAKHISLHQLSISDSRRILFHIFYHRTSAIFARCWLLVEGETEIWLLRQLAEQSGYHLNSEGIQIIEFAQCGLRPLIKYATKMGIKWHVLTDGDMAGKKYQESVKELCQDEENLSQYLTILPARDMENFLFKNGFSHIYKMAAYHTTEHIDLSVSRIIQKAIQKTSKPDLAIEICDDAKKRGKKAIPDLFIQMFKKSVRLANHQVN